ncbi:MAG: phosphoenolpyruvate carboxykinase [Pleurocapsa minor GSE-CHR-MK-17-07R]|jgi:phosphoenolpyruvate carboxykinase (ATP)|nr:phosphoenolpyruvate carboxykinase [Pleurocapsa minor GSE-CHR-MK 17-07R]
MTIKSKYGLENHGFSDLGQVYWNLSTPALYEHAIRNREGQVAHLGPLAVRTGNHTGRSPNDKFIVVDDETTDKVWWGNNKKFSPEAFERLQARLLAYFQQRDVYVQDLYAGADPRYRLPVRVINTFAWHNLFARDMFIRPKGNELETHVPQFTVIDAPGFHATPELDSTLTGTFILLNFTKRLVLIGGTEYAGEMKKSIFSVLNYMLPQQGVLSMHCSANYGKDKEDSALFFGLSGTGKTTLSADPNRTLIGDDEHGWSDNGIFNFEGGCYAKVINLSKEGEPEIYEKTRRFGTIIENVVIDSESRRLDLNDATYTENTRAAYSIETISNADPGGLAGHPKNVVFLTADAFGVLPPVSRLTPEQAMYHFISGYTAKVAGTEKGVTEPSATFSACFGAPFMTLHPTEYATLLRDKLNKHGSTVWLVNTGWSGGSYGVGNRMSLKVTRAIITAVLDGSLENVPTTVDPIFGLQIPVSVPNVPTEILNPRNTWASGEAYDTKARELAAKFRNNFAKYADQAAPEVIAAGPQG